jgi:outer membrane protein assembly factor BamB
MNRLNCALVLGLCVVAWPVARADDWPEFRGPTGQGLARGSFPVEWGPTKNVAWKQAIPGRGWSSPVIMAGRVYLTTSVPLTDGSNDQSLRALCLDSATGQILWNKEVIRQNGATAPGIHGKNSHASPTPLVQGERLYVHFGHQGTACLDLEGNVRWRNTGITYEPVHGNGGSPILVDDLLVFSCDGGDVRFVVALDKETGKVVWKTDRPGEPSRKFSFSTPLLIDVRGRKQIISPGSDMVGAYDPRTGKEIWQVRYEGGYSIIPRPVYGLGLVFICTGYGVPNLLAIRPDGDGDVTDTHVVWRTRKAAPHAPSPLLVGEELYMVSDRGMVSCLDASTGRLYWQESIGGNYSASPICGGGYVYFQSEEGTGVVLKAGKQFQRVARNALGERTLASYAAVDGALFIRTEKNLYRFQAQGK